MSKILYHGTSEANLDDILKNGLKPRGKKKSLWKDHPSAPDRVYLTSAYAIFFANAAVKTGEKAVILKVEVSDTKLVADEDALAQANISDEDFKFLNDLSLTERTKFWRKNAPKYPHLAEFSLNALGNVAHMGVIQPRQIVKFVTYDVTPEMIFGHDPSITLLNYKLLGESYRQTLAKFVDTDGKEGRNGREAFDALWKKVG
jgi:hypothetical protein